jgi:growth arrest-specific protein 8
MFRCTVRAATPRLSQVYKQRIKHLLFEHQNETTVKKTDVQVSMKIAQGEHRTSEGELKRDKRALKQELKEMQTTHDDHMRALKMVRQQP